MAALASNCDGKVKPTSSMTAWISYTDIAATLQKNAGENLHICNMMMEQVKFRERLQTKTTFYAKFIHLSHSS